MSALPAFAAVIVAAGKGLRAGGELPKQFRMWRGKPVLRHSVEAFADTGAAPIIVAIPEGGELLAADALAGIAGVQLVTGGATRQASVLNALETMVPAAPDLVLIHDAARPILSQEVVKRLLGALDDHMGAIPALPVVDSLAQADGSMMTGSAPRERLRRVQTPQAFRYPAILAAHRSWSDTPIAGDDAQVGIKAGMDIALVEGDEALHKLTFAEDFSDMPPVRVGTGYDVHRLAEGEELWLCGVKIEHPRGLAGHSDADVAIHAAVDAILGAAGAGDIGQHFPPNDPQWRGASSDRFLAHALKLAADAGYRLGNLDVTIVCEAPKIGSHRDTMRARLAEIAGVDPALINVKATTTERLGFTGRGEGIAAQAACTLFANN